MPVIGLSGPNAIGKTTAVKRWCARYPGKLLGALADDQREVVSDGGEVDHLTMPCNAREWKGTTEQKTALVEKHRQSDQVVVIDSARTTALNCFLPDEPIILVWCSPELLFTMLRDRAKARGKPFQENYWKDKVIYESKISYANFAAKEIGRVKMFEIRDREKDWPAVDEYFGQLYRRLHNEINRRKR